MVTDTNNLTVKEWLHGLASHNTSTEQDDRKMSNLLHRVGFPNAVSTCGIVYLESKPWTPPSSIHSVAKMLIEVAER